MKRKIQIVELLQLLQGPSLFAVPVLYCVSKAFQTHFSASHRDPCSLLSDHTKYNQRIQRMGNKVVIDQ